MASSIDELSINYEDNGMLLVKQIDKEILTRGTWSTILYRFQELNKQTQAYGDDKFALRRYKKRNDEYWMQSKFTISNKEQAKKIIDTLQKWIVAAA